MSFSGSSKRLRQCKKRRMRISKTISGKKCQKWSKQKPHKHKYAFVGNHNFCRNPKNGHTGVWCYTTSRKKRWEYCAVPKCKLGAAISFENCDIGVDLSFDYATLVQTSLFQRRQNDCFGIPEKYLIMHKISLK